MRNARKIVIAAMLILISALSFALEVVSPEGELYAFPTLLDDKGRPIARSTYAQWFEGGLLHVRITHAFHDGRRTVEDARFAQGKELEQRWWSWEERRGDTRLRAFEVDLVSGRARARKLEDGGEKSWDETVNVERGQTFAGLGVPYAVKNLGGRILRGEDVSIRSISFLPQPVSVRLKVKHAARERIRVSGRMVESDRFELTADLKGLQKIVKLFKRMPGVDVWLFHGRPPMIFRVRYPLAEPWDAIVVIETLGAS